jgi:hypothetical protein
MRTVMLERRESLKEDISSRWLPLSETSCPILWNFPQGSKINGISRLFIKKEKWGKENYASYFLFVKSLPLPFLVVNICAPIMVQQRHQQISIAEMHRMGMVYRTVKWHLLGCSNKATSQLR